MEKLSLEKLNELYESSVSCDEKLFAEMRSNCLLVSGDHYKKSRDAFGKSIRDLNISKDKKVKLTMNFTQKATSDIKDLILNQASSFKCFPRNKDERADQKSAELADSVLEHGKRENDWADFIQREANSFVDIGETACKIYFDPTMGDLKGFNQKLDEEGQPLFLSPEGEETAEPFSIVPGQVDPLTGALISEDQQIDHEMVPDEESPEFRGRVLLEKIYAFNLLRCKTATTMKNSPYLIHRKMADVDKVKDMFANTGDEEADKELRDKIVASANKTYKIFDSNTASFTDSENQVMLREFYFRQCTKYPKGYYVIAIENEILADGEIPYGEFGEIAYPIKHAGYDLIETCPRFASPIRNMRAPQIEINRAISTQAQHQLTVGDDKMLIFSGGAVSKGVDMAGIRVLKVSGREPKIIPGRTGEQFTGYIERMVQYLRYAVGLPNDNVNPASQQAMDPMAELFKGASLKKKFSRQAIRFETYGREIWETYLFLQSNYLEDDQIIRAVGRKEAVNVSEFKNTDRLDYAITVDPVSADYDNKFGKYMALQTVLQYMGKDMPDSIKPAVIKAMPYLNEDPVLQDMLVEYDSPKNMLLAVDRGDEFIPSKYDNAELMLKALYTRVREADFEQLDDSVKERYANAIAEYEQIQSQQADQAMRVQKGIIPSGGSLTKCDVYVNEPKANGGVKTVRATIPSQSVEWLIKQLEIQGIAQERLNEIPQAAALDIMSGVDPQVLEARPMQSEVNQPILPQV